MNPVGKPRGIGKNANGQDALRPTWSGYETVRVTLTESRLSPAGRLVARTPSLLFSLALRQRISRDHAQRRSCTRVSRSSMSSPGTSTLNWRSPPRSSSRKLDPSPEPQWFLPSDLMLPFRSINERQLLSQPPITSSVTKTVPQPNTQSHAAGVPAPLARMADWFATGQFQTRFRVTPAHWTRSTFRLHDNAER